MTLPTQPVYMADNGVTRFRANAIVNFVHDWARDRGLGLNELAAMDFEDADRRQYMQLLGYSIAGYCELGFVTSVDAREVSESRLGKDPRDARIEALEQEIAAMRHAHDTVLGILESFV
jgi:uncharacterized protein YceH (UPF0502 family)